MNIVRADFQAAWKDEQWSVGTQSSMTGVTEVVMVCQCSCGRSLVESPDFWGRRLTRVLVCDNKSVGPNGCDRQWDIPEVVHERAEQLQRKLHDAAVHARATSGGSRQWIPDC